MIIELIQRDDILLHIVRSVRGAVNGLVLVGIGEALVCSPLTFIADAGHVVILTILLAIAVAGWGLFIGPAIVAAAHIALVRTQWFTPRPGELETKRLLHFLYHLATTDRSDVGGLRTVIEAAEQINIARIEQRTAVLQFMYMVAKDPAAGAAAGLAGTATLGQEARYEAMPFWRKVDRLRLFWQRRYNANLDAANRWRNALQSASCNG